MKALDVKCPECGQPPGSKCESTRIKQILPDSHYKVPPHAARKHAAEKP